MRITEKDKDILDFIKRINRIKPKDLRAHFGISKQALYQHTKRLLLNKMITSLGSTPKVYFTPLIKPEKEETQKQIVESLKKNCSYVGIFGSFARKDDKIPNDLDILVSFKKTPSLFEFYDIKESLREKTGYKIDLITKENISPYLKDHIYKDLIDLYGKRS